MTDKKPLRVAYEAVKSLAPLPGRQREIFEVWLYSDATMGQLAVRFGVNRSTISRAVKRAGNRVKQVYDATVCVPDVRRDELIAALQQMKVETGSLVCQGCGHEHSCGVHGCAVMRMAADLLTRDARAIRRLQKEAKDLRRLLQEYQNTRTFQE